MDTRRPLAGAAARSIAGSGSSPIKQVGGGSGTTPAAPITPGAGVIASIEGGDALEKQLDATPGIGTSSGPFPRQSAELNHGRSSAARGVAGGGPAITSPGATQGHNSNAAAATLGAEHREVGRAGAAIIGGGDSLDLVAAEFSTSGGSRGGGGADSAADSVLRSRDAGSGSALRGVFAATSPVKGDQVAKTGHPVVHSGTGGSASSGVRGLV